MKLCYGLFPPKSLHRTSAIPNRPWYKRNIVLFLDTTYTKAKEYVVGRRYDAKASWRPIHPNTLLVVELDISVLTAKVFILVYTSSKWSLSMAGKKLTLPTETSPHCNSQSAFSSSPWAQSWQPSSINYPTSVKFALFWTFSQLSHL